MAFARTTDCRCAGRGQRRRPGQPLLIGAFAFDPAEASCLYVPGCYERGDRPVPPAQAPGTAAMTEQALEANRVISVQSTPPASEFQASVSAALDAFAEGRLAKVVLSRKLTLTLHQPADPKQVMARLMAQNPHAFHFPCRSARPAACLAQAPSCCCGSAGEVFTHPLAGSARRASEPAQDEMVARDLLASRRISMSTAW
ncbi:chorismate-binding protein [Aeromonas hydrophila]|uniref:Chorismate-binding protein n=1 Tax=Aeromonas hydrophila TaxID=644 RepID=A0A926FNF5_AERHY|nr:chorismate-binding protein [Aeromonas hydrophila]